MGSRFVAVLSEDLKERPESVGAILLLVMMVGTVHWSELRYAPPSVPASDSLHAPLFST
jgi:hypothetical protein